MALLAARLAETRALDRPSLPRSRRLAQQNVPLVRRIALRVRRELACFVEVDDLIGPGLEGLVVAAHRFDARRGASFATFAGYRVRGAMIDAARATPRGVISLEQVGEVACERPSVEAQALAVEASAELHRAVAALPKRERHFVTRVYFEGAHVAQAGSEVGISKSWASRIHSRAMRRLRKALRTAI